MYSPHYRFDNTPNHLENSPSGYQGHYRSATPPPHHLENPEYEGSGHHQDHNPPPQIEQGNGVGVFANPHHFQPRPIEPSVFLTGPDEMVGFYLYTSSWYRY